MNDTQDELRRAVDFTFRALHDAATMSDRLEHYARADGDRAAELAKQIKYLNQRIDKVAEIIGERVSGLVDEIAAVRDIVKRAHDRIDDLRTAIGADALVGGNPSLVVWLRRHNDEFNQVAEALEEIRRLTLTPAVPFPTGGADTAEAATEAALPIPQRGDRVRLEGARSTGGTTLTGWYEVAGRYAQKYPGDHDQFQVGSVGSMGLYWVYDTDPGLKEVRHADHT